MTKGKYIILPKDIEGVGKKGDEVLLSTLVGMAHEKGRALGRIGVWATPPKDAATGPCLDPNCFRPRCLDPKVTCSDDDGEPLVLLTYADADKRIWLRINGQDFPMRWPEQLDRATAFLEEHFGTRGMALFERHLEDNVEEDPLDKTEWDA